MTSCATPDPQPLLSQLLHRQSVNLDYTRVGVVTGRHRLTVWVKRVFENLVGCEPGERQGEGCQHLLDYLFSRPPSLAAFETLALAATSSASPA